ncbi:hypothetical protein AIOL_000914 [Candidatus Rhodobacter oscarellae]|uniref:Microcystin LR degradation protein MlrC N-terminal domain-containing protein n=1 Tax=Candidatus Rhodobacter oscarellae TaxID=1675527 RepID=A0A0J9EGF6_9RHOB|nr:M81 family metallopeptidase [Candidatus Rhodobacter lobularis]KMW60749.1 hypothetical protein AIOL_000914 [Candidatus Rhodobacter lobularis]
MRIAVAGFQNGTKTFAPCRAGLAGFERADSWPPPQRGEDVIAGTKGTHLPIAWAMAAAKDDELILSPLGPKIAP